MLRLFKDLDHKVFNIPANFGSTFDHPLRSPVLAILVLGCKEGFSSRKTIGCTVPFIGCNTVVMMKDIHPFGTVENRYFLILELIGYAIVMLILPKGCISQPGYCNHPLRFLNS
jgi:hypothetical protein